MKVKILFVLLLCITSCTSLKNKKEFRGVWIATVENMNWPKTKGVGQKVIHKQKKEYLRILDKIKSLNLNAVVVQVRPAADAFFPSPYEPWSKYLTGVQGKNPGWDPLKFMITETHKRGIEFHAWFNPYRITKSRKDKLSKNHPALSHKDWTFKYRGNLYYNPGHPRAIAYSLKSIMYVVRNYNIDGVHFDDYFYPSPKPGIKIKDRKTFLKYGKAYKNIKDWRRTNVNYFIKNLSKEIKKIKPHVSFGISPFGVWRNKYQDPSGSKSTTSISNYDSLYADTRLWIKKEWIDYIAPQLYWRQDSKLGPYNELVDWWVSEVKSTKVKLYIGQALFMLGTRYWQNPKEIINQIHYNRKKQRVDGTIFFDSSAFFKNAFNINEQLKREFYRSPVSTP